MFHADTFTPQRFTSEGKITLRGEEISYHTVSEDNPFYDDEGKPIASIFSYSYFRDDVENTSDRPVIFCFNGGPGTSSMMVHAGFLAPYRLKYPNEPDDISTLPPYEVVENEECMLDKADIVVIDPVGTGYGLLLDESHEKDFYGIDEDAEALLFFIEGWLERYGRYSSPKYLLGESYGCTRAAMAAGLGQISGGRDRQYNIVFDGLILIGNTVSVGEFFNVGVPIEASVQNFPTFAACNWYHNHPTTQDLYEFAAEARKFAETEYLVALYKGDSLEGDEREHIIERVLYYTGVSREYLEKNGLRVDDVTFRDQVARSKGRQAARLDGRITRPFYEPMIKEEENCLREDPACKFDPPFHNAATSVIFPHLNIKMARHFVPSSFAHAHWNKTSKHGTTAENLSKAMTRTPGMRTFFVSGLYDLCTLIGIAYYTINHAGLPKDRTFIKEYPSGHMVYLGEENVKNMTNDILKFIDKKDPTK